jgi:hypothetical protein
LLKLENLSIIAINKKKVSIISIFFTYDEKMLLIFDSKLRYRKPKHISTIYGYISI